MIYTHEEFFSKYLEYTIPEKTVEDIVKLLDDNTPIHKTVEINKLNKFKVVHCNCSDAEFNLGMDARYEKDIDHIYDKKRERSVIHIRDENVKAPNLISYYI